MNNCLLFLIAVSLLSSFAKCAFSNDRGQMDYPVPRSRFHLVNITAPYFSTERPVSTDLFGLPRNFRASAEEMRPYVHPRILFGRREWQDLISRSADPIYFDKPETWSKMLLQLTLTNGPKSPFIDHLSKLETANVTAVFTGQHSTDFSSPAEYSSYRSSLRELANNIRLSSEAKSHHLFLCAFWAAVYEERPTSTFLDPSITSKCINAAVAWSKVLMAHRTLHCNPYCFQRRMDDSKAFLWNFGRTWSVSDDWHTCGASLSLAYDVLYDKLTVEQRTSIRSAIALLVINRYSWGNRAGDPSSPSAETHPHRMFSNWATYHSNLYITNLAIEGESGFNSYAESTMKIFGSTGFNTGLNKRFEAVIDAYFTHSVYPDGMSFEDGYTWHTAMREGSFGFIARQRRGANIIDTPRFRNTIHAVAQMSEPWQCGHLVGHSGGGGLGYPTYASLFRYAYPNGVLPSMVYAQRFGKTFNNRKCRIMYTQTMMQFAVLGGEHSPPDGHFADAPGSLPTQSQPMFPLSIVGTRRGLIIMRGSHSRQAAYLHFDARPDSFLNGHDNADRGAITFSALGRRWFDDHDWSRNTDSRKHSLFHIDGLAQDVKAPSVTILRVADSSSICLAAADLTYTYNVQWAKPWQGPYGSPYVPVTVYDDVSGARLERHTRFFDKETNTPWDLGWPIEDDAKDIGFHPNMKLFGVNDIGFKGIFQWRRKYRQQFLSHYVRSTAMLRSNANDVGVALIVDSVSFPSGSHIYESYFILHDDVKVEDRLSSCTDNSCHIVLTAATNKELHMYAVAENRLQYRTEEFQEEMSTNKHGRIILRSSGLEREEFWVALRATTADEDQQLFRMKRFGKRAMMVSIDGASKRFALDPSTHVLRELINSETPIPQKPVGTACPDALRNLLTKEGISGIPPLSLENKYGINSKEFIGNVMPPFQLNLSPIPTILRLKDFASDSSIFYHDTKHPYQTVLIIHSDRTEYEIDMISTCTAQTTTRTSVAVFDCGIVSNGIAGTNYERRNCSFIAETSTDSPNCSTQGTDIPLLLQKGHRYCVVVSVAKADAIATQVGVTHTLMPISTTLKTQIEQLANCK